MGPSATITREMVQRTDHYNIALDLKPPPSCPVAHSSTDVNRLQFRAVTGYCVGHSESSVQLWAEGSGLSLSSFSKPLNRVHAGSGRPRRRSRASATAGRQRPKLRRPQSEAKMKRSDRRRRGFSFAARWRWSRRASFGADSSRRSAPEWTRRSWFAMSAIRGIVLQNSAFFGRRLTALQSDLSRHPS
jgi:hypothetical protein